MDKTLTDNLTLLGLDPLAVKFLLAAYKLGPAGITDIGAAARIKRSTAYFLAAQLVKSGYLLEDHRKYGSRVCPITPDEILRRVAAAQRRFRRAEIELEEKLPEIKSRYRPDSVHPHVTFFDGNSGLLRIWRDILSSAGEILLWTNQQTENQFFSQENHDKFIAERVAKNLPIRVLAVDNPDSRNLLKYDSKLLRQTRILPPQTRFSAETYIYGHKVALLDYNRDIIGVITESQPITDFHRANFDLVWQLLK